MKLCIDHSLASSRRVGLVLSRLEITTTTDWMQWPDWQVQVKAIVFWIEEIRVLAGPIWDRTMMTNFSSQVALIEVEHEEITVDSTRVTSIRTESLYGGLRRLSL